MSTRRDFLKTTCGFCVALGTIGFAATVLEGCTSIPVVKASPQQNKLTVPFTAFGESKYVFVRSAGMEADILLVKKTDGTYTALLMQCTHEAQPLTVSGSSIYCASHGSSFDLEGKVVKAPASRPLLKYPVSTDESSIIIQLNQSNQ